MTTPNDKTQTGKTQGESATRAFRSALTGTLLLALAVAVVGGLLGWFIAGLPGLWGALIGAAIALFFCGATSLAMLVSARLPAAYWSAAVLGGYLVKIVVVVIVLLVLRGMDFYSKGVLFGCVVVAVLGSLVIDMVAVHRARVPYIDEGPTPTL